SRGRLGPRVRAAGRRGAEGRARPLASLRGGHVTRVDRRELLGRAGRFAVAPSVAPWWRLPDLLEAVDPRVRALDRELRGDVIGRGASGYDLARQLRNTRFDSIHPLAIAYCETADDVARCVRWATSNGIRLAPRSG